MILNQPDGSKVEHEEPDTRAQMDALTERLKELRRAGRQSWASLPDNEMYRAAVDSTAYVNISPADFEQIRAIVREEVRAAKGKSNEPATALDARALYGMTYRGYSLTELDTMIDFYRMHHVGR